MTKENQLEMNNPKPLRILMVEDSEDDALLIIRELKKGGYNPLYDRVESETAMKRALKEKQWDIILCDYKLPKFSSASAIALLREANIDIPLLIVSGVIGEGEAIECMRLGARDYIMKSNLSRLYPAIAREVEEAKGRNKQKQAEEALRLSEEKYRTILESSQEGYFENDLAGNFTFVNDALCIILGYTREELIGRNNRLYTDKSTHKKTYEIYNGVYRTGEPAKEFDWQILRKDGTKRYLEVTVSLQKNSSGDPIGFRGIARDITGRKQAEEALQRSEAHYRLVVENINDIIWTFDLTSMTYTFVSPSAQRILGYADEAAMKNLDLIFTPETKKNILQAFAKFMEGKGKEDNLVMEVEHRHKDGMLIWMEISASPLKDDQGNIVGFLGGTRDITERKQVEEERKQGFERMRKALKATVQAISMTVEMKDPYTSGHQRRVSDLARSIATQMGLSADRLDFIRTASSIHDIGKIAIPTSILSKPTKLTDLEFNLIKTHSQLGYDILKDIEFPWSVADVVLQHHERMNGTGYPQGLKGDDILLEARILAIADVVEAIASHRPYRPALGIDIALEEISRNKGILYDADAVDVCLKLFREKGYTMAL